MSTMNKSKVSPFTEFAYGKYQNPSNPKEIREGGHLGRVRCSLFDEKHRLLLTGGEDNSICTWKFDPSKANGTIKDESDEKVIAFLNDNGNNSSKNKNDSNNNSNKNNNKNSNNDDEKDLDIANNRNSNQNQQMAHNTYLDNYQSDKNYKQKNNKKYQVEKEFNLNDIQWNNGNGNQNGYGPRRGRN